MNIIKFIQVLCVFCYFSWSRCACHNKCMHRTDNRTRIFGHSAQHITVRVFIMKEDLDLIIEEKWRKRDEFATFISAIEKLPSPDEKILYSTRGMTLLTCKRPYFIRNMYNVSRISYQFQYQAHQRMPLPLPNGTNVSLILTRQN